MIKAPGVKVTLVGQDGNVFNIIGIVAKALRKAGFAQLATEYTNACFGGSSYDEVLRITMEYVEVT